MYTTTLSSKNQITIPKFILEMLAIKSGERLLIDPDYKQLIITPLKESIVDQLAGCMKVPKGKRGVPYKKALDIARTMAAKDIAENSLP